MEKESQKGIRIVLTGPESTGKSRLSELLAKNYQAIYIQEYAREYISQLDQEYNYQDIENIAKKQVEQYKYEGQEISGLVFLDTWLIITKIWFQEVYNKYPDWLDQAINDLKIDHYLLCYPDIEWIPDSLRENGGERREQLFQLYEKELIKLNASYSIIKGIGDQRLMNAVYEVDKVIKVKQYGKL